jgi:hypothetical protein
MILMLLLCLTNWGLAQGKPVERDTNAGILFLAYEGKKDTAGKVTAVLSFQMLRPGSLPAHQPDELPEAGDWILSFLNAEKRVVAQHVVKNPFVNRLEHFSEQGSIQRVETAVTRTEVLLRRNFNADMKELRIELYNGKSKTNILQHFINPIP